MRFSFDFKRALCVLLLAPLGWLAGWHSVSAATSPTWTKVDNRIYFGLNAPPGSSQYWDFVAACCSSSLGSNCESVCDTGSGPMATVCSQDYRVFYSKCSSKPWLIQYWDGRTGGVGQFAMSSSAQSWPSPSPSYLDNVYIQFFLWTSPVWLILLFLWWLRR